MSEHQAKEARKELLTLLLNHPEIAPDMIRAMKETIAKREAVNNG